MHDWKMTDKTTGLEKKHKDRVKSPLVLRYDGLKTESEDDLVVCTERVDLPNSYNDFIANTYNTYHNDHSTKS